MRRLSNISEPPTCIRIPEELKQRAKMVEARTGATFSAIVRVALTKYVNEVLANESVKA